MFEDRRDAAEADEDGGRRDESNGVIENPAENHREWKENYGLRWI